MITTFINWWMPVAAVIVMAVVLVIYERRRRARTRAESASLPVAHSDRLTALPSYRRALRRYRVLLSSSVALVLIALLASITLASRPAAPGFAQPDLASRDIVLCLDVSGSMVDYDAEIVDVFSELSSQFTGERISLVLFNASAVTYFPLSRDYEYIKRQLDRVKIALENDDELLYSGTLLGDGSSLVGDGLAACSLRFDAPETDRSRSIIFASDNVLAGRSIYTLPQAGQLAAENNIRVYGVNPGDTAARDYLSDQATEFESVVVATGGAYFALDDPNAIPSIVDRITSEQAVALPGEPQLILADQPVWPFVALLLGVAGYLVLLWRLRR
jgi:Ca-activated chloride channel family protein